MRDVNPHRRSFADFRAGVALCSLAAALASGVLATPAMAQETEDPAPAAAVEQDEDIIVTGTLIRGVAPAGTNVIGVSSEQVQASGATTTAQLLETIPQMGIFNDFQLPMVSLGGVGITTNKPNLRNLPGNNTSGGSTTLVLLDGHRIVGMGIASTSPDPDIVPPGAIERVEIVPDGGSAIYGSDAVAGVINFITRKKVEGIEADARYGLADDYHSFDANASAGLNWETGSAYVSYNYAEHDAIFGRDRDYVKQQVVASNFAVGPATVTDLRCAPGNVLVNFAIPYALPFTSATAAAGTVNQCDISDDATIYPEEHRHSVFAGVSQALGDSIDLDVRGYYVNRKTSQVAGPFRVNKLIQPFFSAFSPTFLNSPFFFSHVVPLNPNGTPKGDGGFTDIHSVSFKIGDSDSGQRQTVRLESWGITPTITAKLGGGWQLRVLGSQGWSKNTSYGTQIDDAALNTAISAGLFNPYDPGSSTPAALAALTNWEEFGIGRQTLSNVRAIVDGTLFDLPGGGVKVAAGLEWYREGYKVQNGSTIPGTESSGFADVFVGPTLLIPGRPAAPVIDLHRNVKSAFGEVVVPIFGSGNATTALEELTLSVSGRYDDYSDVGNTFNPKVGLTYRPIEWLKFRGAWGKSFNAPSLADDDAATLRDYISINDPATLSFLGPPAGLGFPPIGPGQSIVVLRGNAPDIRPQKAKTLSVGFDVQPPFVPGLDLGLTYYKIKFRDQIGLPPFFVPATYWRGFQSLIIQAPTQAQIDALIANSDRTQGTCFTAACTYAILDIRKQNFGEYKQEGLDFDASYRVDTGFGSIDLGLTGNYLLTREIQPTPALPVTDELVANASRLKFQARAGAEVGQLYGQVTWNHSAGYNLAPAQPLGIGTQTRVADYNVFNLFFRYDVKGESEGLMKALSFTLTVNNVFDTDPPLYRGTDTFTPSRLGYANGSTLGRLVQLGVTTRF